MTTTRKRTPKKTTTAKKESPTKRVGTPLDHVNLDKVIITKQRRNLKELSLLELGLLPFLYLEALIKPIYQRYVSPKLSTSFKK